MKKVLTALFVGILLFSLVGCSTRNSRQAETAGQAQGSTSGREDRVQKEQKIRIQSRDGQNIVFRLNNSPASQSLYEQLPLSVQIEDYSDNEKIFYPPKELDTDSTPLAEGPPGTLAYYAPWGDVAVFYGECQGASGLYEIGEIVSGRDQIRNLKGEVKIEAATETAGN